MGLDHQKRHIAIGLYWSLAAYLDLCERLAEERTQLVGCEFFDVKRVVGVSLGGSEGAIGRRQDQPPAWLEDTANLEHHRPRVGHVLQRLKRHDQVDRGAGQGQAGRVGVDERRCWFQAADFMQRCSIVIQADRAALNTTEHLQPEAGATGDVQNTLARGELGGKTVAATMLAPQFRGRVVGQMLGDAHTLLRRPRAANNSEKRCCQVWSRRARCRAAWRMRSDCSG